MKNLHWDFVYFGEKQFLKGQSNTIMNISTNLSHHHNKEKYCPKKLDVNTQCWI